MGPSPSAQAETHPNPNPLAHDTRHVTPAHAHVPAHVVRPQTTRELMNRGSPASLPLGGTGLGHKYIRSRVLGGRFCGGAATCAGQGRRVFNSKRGGGVPEKWGREVVEKGSLGRNACPAGRPTDQYFHRCQTVVFSFGGLREGGHWWPAGGGALVACGRGGIGGLREGGHWWPAGGGALVACGRGGIGGLREGGHWWPAGGGETSGRETFAVKISPLRKVAKFPPGEVFAACDQQLHCRLPWAPPVQRCIDLLSVRQPQGNAILTCVCWRDHPEPTRTSKQSFRIPGGGGIFPFRNYPRRNCPLANSSPPPALHHKTTKLSTSTSIACCWTDRNPLCGVEARLPVVCLWGQQYGQQFALCFASRRHSCGRGRLLAVL